MEPKQRLCHISLNHGGENNETNQTFLPAACGQSTNPSSAGAPLYVAFNIRVQFTPGNLKMDRTNLLQIKGHMWFQRLLVGHIQK